MIKYVIVRVIVTVFGVILFNKSIKKKKKKNVKRIIDQNVLQCQTRWEDKTSGETSVVKEQIPMCLRE